MKEVEFGPVEATELRVKPNLPLLGPKLGKELGPVRAKLEAGEFEELDGGRCASTATSSRRGGARRASRQGGLGGRRRGRPDGRARPALDPELELEGRAREAIHQVNTMRKELGLEITDRIALTLPPSSPRTRSGSRARRSPRASSRAASSRSRRPRAAAASTARARMSRSARWSAAAGAIASGGSFITASTGRAARRRRPSASAPSPGGRPRRCALDQAAASSRSTIPVTFEASQKSRSASALIGIGCSGSSMRRACACAKPSPSSASARRPSRAAPCRSRRRAAAPRAPSSRRPRRHASEILETVGS